MANNRNSNQGKNDQPAANGSGAPGKANSAAAAGQNDARDADKSASSTPGLEVTSSQDGFWRGDLQWSSAPTVVKLSDLSEHQVEQIMGEPMLTVVKVDVSIEQEGE